MKRRAHDPGSSITSVGNCGCEKEVKAASLRNGSSSSCGCKRKEYRKHGYTIGGQSPEYVAWNNMMRRCRNPQSPEWHNYGGRGIRVCDEWHDFAVFIRDMGPRPSSKHTLDRINNDGPYAAGNVRWALMKVQANNRRGNIILIYQGETLPIAEWAERTGIPHGTLQNRVKQGWETERILTEPYHENLAIHTPRPRENWNQPKPPKPPKPPRPKRPRVTHCIHGHEMTEENSYWTSAGKRHCRACQKNRQEALKMIRAQQKQPPPPPATHCKRGHLYDAANTRVDKRGHRSCIACRNITRLAHKEHTGR